LLGEFEEEIAFERTPRALEVLNESKYVVRYAGQKDHICIITKHGELLQSFFSYDITRSTGLFKDLIKYRDKVLFHQNYNDTIYNLSDEGMKPWLFIDFGERRVTSEMATKSYEETMRLKRGVGTPAHTLTGSHFYTESDERIFFMFEGYVDGHYVSHHLFHNKKSESTIIFPPGPGSNVALFQKYKCLYGIFIQDVNSDGQLLGHLDPFRYSESIEEIKDLVKEGFVTIDGTTSIEALNSLDENSNPFIAVYTFHETR